MPDVDLISCLLRRWYVIVLAAIAGAAAGLLVSEFMTPVYRAEAILAPVETESSASGLGDLMGQFGGLASMAGIQLPRGGDPFVAIETLKSRDLTEKLIASQNLMPVLFADEWDERGQRWSRNPPTISDALELFEKKLRAVRLDTKTRMVYLRIEWIDAAQAASWANALVYLTNRILREREIEEAEKTIEALTFEIDKAANVDVRAALYRLIETQLKAKAVAAGREQFAFRVVDTARVPDIDKPVWPRKSLLALVGFLFSAVATAIIVFAFALRSDTLTR